MLNKFNRNESGAITLSDIFIVLVSAVFIGAVAVPFMLGQQADLNQRAAALTARSVAVEVETFLLTHPNDDVPEPVEIVHTPSQELIVPLVTIEGTEGSKVSFTLGTGVSLVKADPRNDAISGANIIYSRDNYCIAVQKFGMTAYHNQSGPTENCSAKNAPAPETSAATEEVPAEEEVTP